MTDAVVSETNRHRVLVVDDQEALRRALVRSLALAGFEAVPAEDGRAAIELFKSSRFDAVVSDIAMPNMTGIDLLRALREHDVMIAISFTPYAEETLRAAQCALQRGAPLIAITDSRMSPLAGEARAALLVQESSTFGFRALTNAMALAQSLFIALAYRLELDYQPTHAAQAR